MSGRNRRERETRMIQAVVTVAVAVLAFWGVLYLHTDVVPVEVTGFLWHREIDVHEYTLVVEEGTRMPPGAVYVSERDECMKLELHTWCPQCYTVYRYMVHAWVMKRKIETSGDDHAPYWGEVDVDPSLPDPEREGERRGTYTVTLRTLPDEEAKYFIASEALWNDLDVGMKVDAYINHFGSVRGLEVR